MNSLCSLERGVQITKKLQGSTHSKSCQFPLPSSSNGVGQGAGDEVVYPDFGQTADGVSHEFFVVKAETF